MKDCLCATVQAEGVSDDEFTKILKLREGMLKLKRDHAVIAKKLASPFREGKAALLKQDAKLAKQMQQLKTEFAEMTRKHQENNGK